MLADRVVILENGRISEEGPTREVLQRPRSRFAAGLAGLNFLAGEITEHGLQAGGLNLYGQHHDLPGPLPTGQPGVAVFPPSAVSVFLSEAHGSPRNAFPVTITDLEPHGDQIRVRAGESGQLSADITPAAAADLGLAPGMRVYFVIKAGAVAIYPGLTTDALSFNAGFWPDALSLPALPAAGRLVSVVRTRRRYWGIASMQKNYDGGCRTRAAGRPHRLQPVPVADATAGHRAGHARVRTAAGVPLCWPRMT